MNEFQNNNGGMVYIPPKPIGNIVGFNNAPQPINQNQYGMMGGYYNNNYYMNPWEYKQMIERQEAQRKQELSNQSSIWKKISMACNKEMDNVEEHVKIYDHMYDIVQPDREVQQYLRLVNLVNMRDTNRNLVVKMNNQKACKLYEEQKKKYPDDMSLVEYFDKSGELYAEILKDNSIEQQRNMQKLYNSNLYNQLINIHSNNDVNIDDMTIKLPVKLQDSEYQKRRKMFLDQALK